MVDVVLPSAIVAILTITFLYCLCRTHTIRKKKIFEIMSKQEDWRNLPRELEIELIGFDCRNPEKVRSVIKSWVSDNHREAFRWLQAKERQEKNNPKERRVA